MKIVIIGTGYVGLVSGACFAAIGHQVVCVDTDPGRVAGVNNSIAPFYEKDLNEILAKSVSAGNLRATVSLSDAMHEADVSLIAVGTPFDGRDIDLQYIKTAAKDIASFLSLASRYHVVCVKSTVVPGTTQDVVGPILERHSDREIGIDLGLAMNPEFLAEGSAVADFMNPDRIVIGSNDQQAAQSIVDLYSPFKSTEIFCTELSTAEMIKYTANSFLATVISFSNEIANLCSKLKGVDVVDVMKGVHSDRRLSPILDSGRITPGLMSFLYPGTGFGGSCFPKDVKALISFSEKSGAAMPVLRSVIDTNGKQPSVTVELVKEELGVLMNKRIAILGLAFKPGTDDVRESPALQVIEELIQNGADIIAHDPIAIENMEKVLKHPKLDYCHNLSETINAADAIVLVTSWPDYKNLHSLLNGHKTPVIDGRRSLDKINFKTYRGIGLCDN